MRVNAHRPIGLVLDLKRLGEMYRFADDIINRCLNLCHNISIEENLLF